MLRKIRFPERGQSIVLVAVLMIGFIAILAVVIDGSLTYMQRRQAQVAADAGALAGARELCLGNDGAAYGRAQEYACDLNGADPPPDTLIDVDVAHRRVTVTSSINFQTFFARLLGQPEMTAKAIASAGCYSPCYGEGVLPIVWSCRPPVDPDLTDSLDCEQQRITWDELQVYLAQSPPQVNPELYVVMDSLTYESDVMCIQDPDYDPSLPYTFIDCDFDGDGEADFLASGGRSWVDLDGADPADNCPPATGEGASELSRWIRFGYDCKLDRHLWIAEQTGIANSIFDTVYDRWQNGNPLVLVPVFDDFCKDGNPYTFCPDRVHNNPPDEATDTIHPVSGNHQYFHVIDYAAFYITCVRKTPSDSCPGQTRFAELNGPPPDGNDAFNNGQLNNMRSIEGYFLDGIPEGAGGKCDGGVDTGVYTLYLDQ